MANREERMVILQPMLEHDFQTYYEDAIARYAAEHVRSGNWSPEESLERSRQEYEKLLPQGTATPNQYLYSVIDPATNTNVGMIWYAIREKNAQRIAFIYEISIKPEYQRRGYSQQTMQTLETLVRNHGVTTIQLHVFGHNHAARALYEKLGYQPTNIAMSKTLDP